MTRHKSFISPTHALLLASPIRPAAPILTLTDPDGSFDILCDPLTGSVTTISTRPSSLRSRRSEVISLPTNSHLNKLSEANGALRTAEGHINIPQKSKNPATEEWLNRQETPISRTGTLSVSVDSQHPPQSGAVISSSFPGHLIEPLSTSQDMGIGVISKSLPSPNQPSIKVNHSGVRRSSLSSPTRPPLVNLVVVTDDMPVYSSSPSISSARHLENPGPLASLMISFSRNTRCVFCVVAP
jgi:hypothetical protein